jgi:hypothetical protein
MNDVWFQIASFANIYTFLAISRVNHNLLSICQSIASERLQRGSERLQRGSDTGLSFQAELMQSIRCICGGITWNADKCWCKPCTSCDRMLPPAIYIAGVTGSLQCIYGCMPHCRACRVTLSLETRTLFNERVLCRKCHKSATENIPNTYDVAVYLYKNFQYIDQRRMLYSTALGTISSDPTFVFAMRKFLGERDPTHPFLAFS